MHANRTQEHKISTLVSLLHESKQVVLFPVLIKIIQEERQQLAQVRESYAFLPKVILGILFQMIAYEVSFLQTCKRWYNHHFGSSGPKLPIPFSSYSLMTKLPASSHTHLLVPRTSRKCIFLMDHSKAFIYRPWGTESLWWTSANESKYVISQTSQSGCFLALWSDQCLSISNKRSSEPVQHVGIHHMGVMATDGESIVIFEPRQISTYTMDGNFVDSFHFLFPLLDAEPKVRVNKRHVVIASTKFGMIWIVKRKDHRDEFPITIYPKFGSLLDVTITSNTILLLVDMALMRGIQMFSFQGKHLLTVTDGVPSSAVLLAVNDTERNIYVFDDMKNQISQCPFPAFTRQMIVKSSWPLVITETGARRHVPFEEYWFFHEMERTARCMFQQWRHKIWVYPLRDLCWREEVPNFKKCMEKRRKCRGAQFWWNCCPFETPLYSLQN